MNQALQKKVLIVDDDIELCRSLQEKLESDDLAVEVSHDGKSGLESIRSSKPDLVLLDILMPGISGTELLSQYESSENEHSPKFIILTNQDNMDTMSEVFKHEVTDYVTKATTSLDSIVALIKNRLDV